ncbi:hypothetical protein COV19_07185 [Candidatus Woesearchaeota archaeon CG10_big_fil_rev_8_21_14_0_10_44_13]|nr:MAG: hypothetical protein COV19_07185 [Candidatus Woesearchaeota archaeon CG10_big_fil_rev_8_21_14_0_10_44_13]
MNGKKRCKKGQMAAFVLIGLILLIGSAALTYVLYVAKKAPSDQYFLEQLPESLDKTSLDTLMRSCIKKVSDPELIRIAKYGGTISPKVNEYRTYNKTRYRYLCDQKPGYTECVNKILTRESMQEELQDKITVEVAACMSPALKFYEDRGYEIKSSQPSTKVIIAPDDVNVIVNYPLVVSKDATKINTMDYSVQFDYPLGKLYDLAMEILNSENSAGYFNQEGWMFNHSIEVLIQKHRPYPDVTYKLSKYDWEKKEHYVFNFALQGYDRLPELAGLGSLGSSGQMIASPAAARSNAYDQNMGCCNNKKDGNCFENADKSSCMNNGLEFRTGTCAQSGFTCKPISEDKFDNRTGLCYGRRCNACMNGTYEYGDNVNDPSTYSGPAKMNGESWCSYEGPSGQGLDAVGSRHYKQICVDGSMLVEECGDYRTDICVEQAETINGRQMTRAVCRPNRWQDCHLFGSNQAECTDTGKRDCYWNVFQDNFLLGKPRDQSEPGTVTSYEERHCAPQVPPGLRFWNTLEGMQVCGWANNYYECAAPGCFQEWTEFDAIYCAMQGDCGIYRNYLGKLPELSLNNLFPGAGQLPGVGTSSMGGGFVSAPNLINNQIYELVLPNAQNFALKTYQKAGKLPSYPKEWYPKTVTPDMFIHNSPNDYSMLGIMSFFQRFVDWGMDKLNNIEDDIWDLIVHGESMEWTALGVSMCNVWTPSTSAIDCEKCNGNPYRPCTEYKCRSLGMYCNYEEIDGVGKCSSYETSTIGKPVVQFDGQITPGYTTKGSTLASSDTAYVGKEIIEALKTDYTFQIKTNRETQCMLTVVPGASFGMNPPFPGTATDYSFRTKHNLTIPYTTADGLSVMLLPLQLMSMISFNPDQIWAIFNNMANRIITYMEDLTDDCNDCNDWDPSTGCGNIGLMALSNDDCDEMEDKTDQIKSMFSQITDFWQNTVKPEVEKWLNTAQKNAIDEVLNYAVAQHKYHAFVKCRDRGGNENEVDLDFIRFKISPNPLAAAQVPDGPPIVRAIEPQNWTEQSPDEAGRKEVYVYLNQLSECAYGTSDQEFIYMNNKFQCPKSTYYGGLAGGYVCNSSRPFDELKNPGAPIYIKCIDHPEHYETFSFRLEQGTEYAGPQRSEWIKPITEGEPGTVIIKDPKTINQSMEKITVPSMSVKFFIEFKRQENDNEKALECRYAPTQAGASSGTTFVDPKSGGTQCDNCTALLTATGTDYYVWCHFKTEQRNAGQAYQYVLQEAAAEATT